MMISDFEICPLKSEIKESISVGCTPPACEPYLVVSHVPCRGRVPIFLQVPCLGWVPNILGMPTPLNIPPPLTDLAPEISTPGKDMGSEIPALCGQADTCENITFPQLRFAM